MVFKLDINSIFSFHPADTNEKAMAHDLIRSGAKDLARNWDSFVPDSAEKTLAIRHLQQAMMFANSAIAQYGSKD